MTEPKEALASIERLRQSSRVAIPLSLAAFLSILGMLWVSGHELAKRRAAIAAANIQLEAKQKELQRIKAETARLVSQAESRLRIADEQIEVAARSTTNEAREVSLQAARQELAVADAALAATTTAVTRTARLPDQPLRFGGINVDVFYCQAAEQATRPIAQSLFGLRDSNGGRWRVRPLSETINASEGYRLNANVIRYNNDELQIARNLADDARLKLNVDLRLQQVSYSTPGYLSVFICAPSR